MLIHLRGCDSEDAPLRELEVRLGSDVGPVVWHISGSGGLIDRIAVGEVPPGFVEHGRPPEQFLGGVQYVANARFRKRTPHAAVFHLEDLSVDQIWYEGRSVTPQKYRSAAGCGRLSWIGEVAPVAFLLATVAGFVVLITRSRGRPVTAPAAWYLDPTTPNTLRWWNGAAWTEHVASRSPPVG